MISKSEACFPNYKLDNKWDEVALMILIKLHKKQRELPPEKQ